MLKFLEPIDEIMLAPRVKVSAARRLDIQASCLHFAGKNEFVPGSPLCWPWRAVAEINDQEIQLRKRLQLGEPSAIIHTCALDDDGQWYFIRKLSFAEALPSGESGGLNSLAPLETAETDSKVSA